jgi:hypothetical protein
MVDTQKVAGIGKMADIQKCTRHKITDRKIEWLTQNRMAETME